MIISRFTPLAGVTCKSPCHTTPESRQEERRESLQKYMLQPCAPRNGSLKTQCVAEGCMSCHVYMKQAVGINSNLLRCTPVQMLWAYFGSSWWVVLSLSWLILARSWLILGRISPFLGLSWAVLAHLGPVFGKDGSQDGVSWGGGDGAGILGHFGGAKIDPKSMYF